MPSSENFLLSIEPKLRKLGWRENLNLTSKNEEGHSLLEYIFSFYSRILTPQDIKALVSFIEDPNAQTSCGGYLFPALLIQGEEIFLDFFQKHKYKIDINLKDKYGFTVLILAGKSSLKTVNTLLKNGADINAASNTGQTCLMMASRSGNTEVVKFLLKKGADVLLKNDHNKSAIDLTPNHFTEIKEMLRKKEEEITIQKEKENLEKMIPKTSLFKSNKKI